MTLPRMASMRHPFQVSAKEHLKSTIATVAQTTNDNPLGGVGEVNNRRGESAAPAASGTSKGSGGVEVGVESEARIFVR